MAAEVDDLVLSWEDPPGDPEVVTMAAGYSLSVTLALGYGLGVELQAGSASTVEVDGEE